MRLIILLIVVLSLGCASTSVKPDGEVDARTFGKGEVTVETPNATTITVESHGISDNFLGALSGLWKAAQAAFGGGGGTTVIVSGGDNDDGDGE